MKFLFIEEHRSKFRVQKMCEVLKVSRSGYYKWQKSLPSEREKQRGELAKRIQHHYEDSHGLYGSPKITHLLRQEGRRVSEKTVGRLMREHGLRSRTVRKFKVQTTDSNHDMPVAPNLLEQQFRTESPNQVWVSDITYIRTREGMLYLASVMDLFSRRIVGWALGQRMTVDLVSQALDAACAAKKSKPALIHHSDRGSQYASKEYRGKLEDYNMTCSMSRKGNCYDNACIESYHSILKRELVYLTKFKNRQEAKQKIYHYLEFFYNRKRIHSYLGYMSPDRFEQNYYRKKAG